MAMETIDKSRGRHSTPTQRRFPSLRGRSSSRGRPATPTTPTGNNDKDDLNGSNHGSSGGTPGSAKRSGGFKKGFKKLIPKSNSKTTSRRNTSQSPAPSSNNSNNNNNKHNGHGTPNRSSDATPTSSTDGEDSNYNYQGNGHDRRQRQTRSVHDNHPPSHPATERDAPESGPHTHTHAVSSNDSVATSTTNPRHAKKQIHNESERDGFCRRVDYYDGQTIHVDGVATYEVGNYLGGGVAGVVYEGQRLRPLSEYPVRSSYQEMLGLGMSMNQSSNSNKENNNGSGSFNNKKRNNSLLAEMSKNQKNNSSDNSSQVGCAGIFCGPSHSDLGDTAVSAAAANDLKLEVEHQFLAGLPPQSTSTTGRDSQTDHNNGNGNDDDEELKDESVAIKILNPVGFRLLSPSACASAVVVQPGQPLSDAIRSGSAPMDESHVWWLVNPSSKNLRTLQRNPSPIVGRDFKEGEKIGLISHPADLYNRGSRDQGIRLSLVAAYMDPKSGSLRELPLTRCIEIWGHAPFGTTEEEFENMMDAIERVNQGHSNPDFDNDGKGKGSGYNSDRLGNVSKKDSGLYRAATAQKNTVHCKQLSAFITVPAVPPKYIRWLRQRRAVTKEIRNMMRIGRHKNVVHLFEVMELIQDSKSTMFLVLELVKGGELFDLISTNSKSPAGDSSHEENERTMLNFFVELASGIAYCHANGIAHRDLKPENLLVHNEADGNCTLKIADFGLSSTFNLTKSDRQYHSQRGGISCGIGAGAMDTPNSKPPPSPSPVTGFSPLLTHKLSSALSFLTCGGMEQLTECFGSFSDEPEHYGKSLNRMTSIVGSPHYVAPEIISQTDEKKSSNSSSVESRGYDGTKADVWSAGVILYAMLFRSLPFGEDLLRCPRYQSFTKWYNEARSIPGGRRASAAAALSPINLVNDSEDLGPHWFFPSTSKTSPESKDIIVAMLNPDPAHRLEIQQVLIHPWIQLRTQ